MKKLLHPVTLFLIGYVISVIWIFWGTPVPKYFNWLPFGNANAGIFVIGGTVLIAAIGILLLFTGFKYVDWYEKKYQSKD